MVTPHRQAGPKLRHACNWVRDNKWSQPHRFVRDGTGWHFDENNCRSAAPQPESLSEFLKHNDGINQI